MKFYITTAIDYVNAKPHIGHVFEKILADVIARYHREIGDDVFFLTGSDEHGTKVERSAKEAGKSPQEFVNDLVQSFVDMKKLCNLSWDRFIRTTDEDHLKTSQELWKQCKAKGDIYLQKYKGAYCVGCESFIKESDLVDGKCPNHNTAPEILEEENWFFKLVNYKDEIKGLISSDELKIFPDFRKKEILNVLDEIEDFSISRPKEKMSWGVEVPDDASQIMYVWFDALTNYITGAGAFEDMEKFKKYWPADVHFIGKDITRFHAIYWPAMLLSAELKLPKAIFAHGFVTADGKKMSKTLGNVIGIEEAVSKYGVDAFRYFMIREGNLFDDLDFTWERLEIRYNELANGLGNLISRTSNLAEKDNILSNEIIDVDYYSISNTRLNYKTELAELSLDNALDAIWEEIEILNMYLSEKEPWKIKDNPEERRRVILLTLAAIKDIAKKLAPFLPETSEKILNIFKQEKIVKAEPLFPKK